ncbi:MAG: hypothetical protein MET45_17685 [Nostoc sp. LLA-1]|nr:hypothetical protein [Cyanocohniella sp. LLY]
MFGVADAVSNIAVVLVLTKGMKPEKRNQVMAQAIIVAIARLDYLLLLVK